MFCELRVVFLFSAKSGEPASYLSVGSFLTCQPTYSTCWTLDEDLHLLKEILAKGWEDQGPVARPDGGMRPRLAPGSPWGRGRLQEGMPVPDPAERPQTATVL